MATNMFQTNQPKKKGPSYTNDTILESLRGVGASVGKTVTKDVVGKIGGDVLSSLLGSPPKAGELHPDQELHLGRQQERVLPQQKTELQPRIAVVTHEDLRTKQQIEAIRQELKALAASLKGLHQEVQQAVAEAPVDPGIYHVNFFERLKSLLTILRQQIEDSRTWLALWTTRRKKMGYWGMFKKHGTKFGLSSERSLATQAG